MPRKPRPAIPLVIERLSNGREVRPQSFTCDITGEEIPVVQDARPARKVLMPEDVQRQRSEAKLLRTQRVLVLSGLTSSEPKQVELIPKGKRKLCEINGKAVLVDKPKWRRI